MIGVRELTDLARPAPAPLGGDVGIATRRLVTSLAGARPKMPTVAERLTYPKAGGLVAVGTLLERTWSAQGPAVAAELEDVLRRPLRAYPLSRASDGTKRFALIAAWDNGRAAVASVALARSGATASVETYPSILSTELAERLEVLYPDISPAVRAGDQRRGATEKLLCVADPGRMGSLSGPGWRLALAAVSESWSYSMEFLDTTATDYGRAKEEMDLFGGRALVVVSEAAGPFRSPGARHPRWRHQAIELDRADAVGVLEDLRIHLELGLVQPPMVTTWNAFADRIDELEGAYLVLTDSCRASLASCRYHDPSRMWSFLARLSEAARQRREEGWPSTGRAVEWMRERAGIEVALFDQTLGDADFEFEGQTMSRLPHVKVDDYKRQPEQCGRIHFAIDDANQRLVVDHVGLHL